MCASPDRSLWSDPSLACVRAGNDAGPHRGGPPGEAGAEEAKVSGDAITLCYDNGRRRMGAGSVTQGQRSVKRQRAKVASSQTSSLAVVCSQTDFITPAPSFTGAKWQLLRSHSAGPVRVHLMQPRRNPNEPPALPIPTHDLISGCGTHGTRSKYTPHDLSLQRSTTAAEVTSRTG